MPTTALHGRASAIAATTDTREWVALLARYREPSGWRSAWEIGVKAVPFIAL